VVVNLVCLKVKLRSVALGYRLENSDRAVWGSALLNVRATILRFQKQSLDNGDGMPARNSQGHPLGSV
jgi:hypothetical protein